MAVASLNEVIQSHIMRRNIVQRELSEYSAQKTLATYETTDLTTWHNNQKMKIRNKWESTYSLHPAYDDLLGNYCNYNNGTYYTYTEIEEYQTQIDIVDAKYEDELAELTSWETQLDAQISAENVELSEIKAYMESFKNMLSNNVKSDYQYSSN